LQKKRKKKKNGPGRKGDGYLEENAARLHEIVRDEAGIGKEAKKRWVEMPAMHEKAAGVNGCFVMASRDMEADS